MSRRRIAIVGLGMAVAPHARSLIDLAERVEVVAAHSRSKARRRAFVAEYGLPVTGDLDALFADRSIEAVMLLTPPNTHLELVRRAAAAGMHILLEKPLEVSTERAEALVATAAAAGVQLGVVLQNRFRPNSLALARLVGEGRLGRLVGASARVFNWRPQSYYDAPGRGTRARDGGGVLLTQGIHTLDLLIALAGTPEEVFAHATTTPIHRMETEDLVAATVRFSGGAIGVISATTCAFPGFPERIELIGTQGTAVTEGAGLLARFHDGTELRVGDAAAGGGTGADPMAFAHDAHRALLADFLAAIETGREPAVAGRHALMAHRLIDALLASAASGEPAAVRQP